jgi:hypothetical protein
MWRTRQAHGSHRPSPAGGGIFVAARGKDFQAPCRSDIIGICPVAADVRRLISNSEFGVRNQNDEPRHLVSYE